MANIPDLITLLNLDPQKSVSPFGGRHRTILISKDFTNTGDFVFSNLLHHFVRREPTAPILLVTLSHSWTNYSAAAAKCGFNLRRIQNSGNIEVLDIMSKTCDAIKHGDADFDPCKCILDYVSQFIKFHSQDNELREVRVIKPVTVMVDDLSILLAMQTKANDIFRLFSLIDKSLRARSNEITVSKLSHFVVQTMTTDLIGDEFKYAYANMENLCDISLTLKPLETGYSTRVDGTIKIVDNRLTSTGKAPDDDRNAIRFPTSIVLDSYGDIGTKRAFFYKLGDRRVRLTSSALIF